MSKTIALKASRLVTPYRTIRDGIVIIEGEKIAQAGGIADIKIPEEAALFDFGDKILAPGFFDIHIHGCVHGRCDDSEEAVAALSEFIVKSGTTSFLPTPQTSDGAKNAVQAYKKQKAGGFTGAKIIGIHMEGPFLTPKNLENAPQADARLLPPSIPALEAILEVGEGLIKLMGVGIEQPGAMEVVARLLEEGIIPSVAHSKTDLRGFNQAVSGGIRHATHLFNVMTGFHHRRAGIVNGILTNDSITTEVICDGLHLDPTAIDVAIRCKGFDKLAMITDLTIGGMEDGDYGRIVIKDGVARIKGADPNKDNTLAGSMTPINVGVRNVVKLGYPLHEAVKMASLSPAKIIGASNLIGSLEPGKCADIIAFDDEINVSMVMINGAFVVN